MFGQNGVMENETTETSTSGCGMYLVFFLFLLHGKQTQLSFFGEIGCSNVFMVFIDMLFYMLGSLILEMGALSRLTGDPRFESVALRALRQLWRMRSSLDLLGTTLDVVTGEWLEYSSGIGAGMLFIFRRVPVAILVSSPIDGFRILSKLLICVESSDVISFLVI